MLYWTKRKPAKAGYYFCRTQDDWITFVHISEVITTLRICTPDFSGPVEEWELLASFIERKDITHWCKIPMPRWGNDAP